MTSQLGGQMSDDEALTLQDVIDAGAWGPEPGKDYLERLDMLDNVVRECIWVAKRYAGILAPEGRHFYASVLFVSMITRGVSLLNLAPYSSWAVKKIEHWDYSSMTGVARTMLELRAAFHYLCTDPCDTDEWYCRWNLFNLHDCVSRIRLFEAQGNADQVAGLTVQADELRDRLRENLFFQSLGPKRHKKLLHGQTAYLFPLEAILERAGLPTETFRWLYVLFSTHVHGLPMSFYRIGGDNPERGRGLPSPAEESYSTLCLSLAMGLLVETRDEIHQLFEGLEKDPAYIDPDAAGHRPSEGSEEAELSIGETASTDLDDELQLVRKRSSQDEVEITYVHRATGDPVFNGTASDTLGLQFEYIDPYFWRITINGETTSRAAIERMMDGEFMMRVDLDNRRILFKTRENADSPIADQDNILA